MATRLDLHNKLKELLGLPNVYYQSPENTKMEYPAIRYSLSKISSRYADNTNYSNLTRYEIIVIDRKPDNPVIRKILDCNYASYDRHYVSDNLNHDVLTIYF